MTFFWKTKRNRGKKNCTFQLCIVSIFFYTNAFLLLWLKNDV